MKIEFVGRGMEVTDALKKFTEEKLSKLSRFVDNILDVQVRLSVERHRHIAEIVIKAGHEKVVAKETTNDMYASIGGALDKIEKQLKKSKDKFVSKKKKLTVREEGAFTINTPKGEEIVISHRKVDIVKPLTKEEAIMEMENNGADFIVFRDAENKEAMSILYKKNDKNYHLITLD